MNVVAFNGSPRGRNSNTGKIVDALLKGMSAAGAETQHVILAEKTIKPCTGCMSCWFKTLGTCVHQDDMPELTPLIDNADLVIYATPLYVDNVTALMKTFLDRHFILVHPHMIMDDGGEPRHPRRVYRADRKMMVVACCGFPMMSHFQTLDLIFKRMARNMSATVSATIFRTTGELLKGAVPQLMPIVERYLLQVEQAGRAIVETGGIPADLQATLDAPMVPDELFIAEHNKFCEAQFGPLPPQE
jgi:multimeric flavodoxin WrbA